MYVYIYIYICIYIYIHICQSIADDQILITLQAGTASKLNLF